MSEELETIRKLRAELASLTDKFEEALSKGVARAVAKTAAERDAAREALGDALDLVASGRDLIGDSFTSSEDFAAYLADIRKRGGIE